MRKGRRRYCHSCGGPVSHRIEDGIRRDFCPVCNLFFYENPLPVVSTIVDVDRRILMVKRGKRPYRGSWCLPTGFAEAGESIQGAGLERTGGGKRGIEGRILSLVDVRSYGSRFYGDLLFITFEVELLGGSLQPKPGSDTVAARFIPPGASSPNSILFKQERPPALHRGQGRILGHRRFLQHFRSRRGNGRRQERSPLRQDDRRH